ncbi:hypothetical protein LTS18_003635, partial [Coniosporium uncinatum]
SPTIDKTTGQAAPLTHKRKDSGVSLASSGSWSGDSASFHPCTHVVPAVPSPVPQIRSRSVDEGHSDDKITKWLATVTLLPPSPVAGVEEAYYVEDTEMPDPEPNLPPVPDNNMDGSYGSLVPSCSGEDSISVERLERQP